MRNFLSALVLSLCLLPAAALAQQPTPELQALDDALPGNLINDPSRLDWDVFGKGQTVKTVKAADIPGGGAAVQFTIPKKGATLFESGANVPLSVAVKPGSDFVVRLYARTLKSDAPDGKGRIGLRIQENAAPYPGFGDQVLIVGSQWEAYEVTMHSDKAIRKGFAIVGYQLSGAKQIIEIGQTIVVEGVTSIAKKTVVAAPAAPATADGLPIQLAGKGRLINRPADRNWQLFGANVTQKAQTANIVGGAATQYVISKAATNAYDIGIVVPITEAIKEGDVLTVAVLARAVASEAADGAGKLGLRVQKNAAPYPGFGDTMVSPGASWRLIQLRTQAKLDIEKGAGAVSLHLGAAKQTVEIGQVYVLVAPAP
jgi:hypothetical protein